MQNRDRVHIRAAISSLALTVLLGASGAAAAPRDRTPPTTPRNLRVTATTPYTVSLAWTPSTDNSGSFNYVFCCGAGSHSQTVPAPASSVTITTGLEANRPFSFRMFARDAAGNSSGYSNSVSGTLPPDRTPPETPAVSVTDVGPTHVSLLWSSVEDGPHVWFTVFRDGTPVLQGIRDTSAILPLLTPETAYTFTVRARDFGGNLSPLSGPLSATTEPSNPDDVTAPTTPGNFRGSGDSGCEEVELRWEQSTDDLDPQFIIRYDIYLNDVLDHSLSLGRTRTIVYGTDAFDTFEIAAVDTAGNTSARATLTESDVCR
jgi:chitodextrinase